MCSKRLEEEQRCPQADRVSLQLPQMLQVGIIRAEVQPFEQASLTAHLLWPFQEGAAPCDEEGWHSVFVASRDFRLALL